jgi:acetoin utilization deacetylase AcuC-like enzyme
MLPFPLVYSERYDLNLGAHVFPSQKFRWLHDRFLRSRFATAEDFVEPAPASDEDILRVHTPEWVSALRYGTISYHDILRLEIPYSQKMVEAFWMAAGGSTLAARHALSKGVGFNVGGGFHHAFAGHGEGFCAVNDIAVAVRSLQHEKLIAKAMVVDCDVHHGNGTAAIFAGDPSVFTLSIHQFNNYPAEKPPSSLDIHLPDGIADGEYLYRLSNPYRNALTALTMDGLRERDRLVIWTALSQQIPVAIVLAGGYAQSVEDTVTIHANTAEIARETLAKVGWIPRPAAG